MPVRKYEKIEDVPPPPRPKTAYEGLKLACELSTFTAKLGRLKPRPGVRTFRRIEEAKAYKK